MDEKLKGLCDTVLDYMDELSPVIIKLYEEIREYDLSGITVLGDVSEGMAWLSNAVGILDSELNLNISDEVGNILSQIREVVLAMENNDYLFLADILEFDVISNMDKIFNAVRDAS